jgi:hypothetical protein
LIVEERELVEKDELELARAGEEDHGSSRRKEGPQRAGEIPIQRSLKRTKTTIQRAPKGMRRNLENETTWSMRNKSINWQVEWIRKGDAGRILSKAMGNQPIGEIYAAIMEVERIRAMSEEERRMMKKRKAGGPRQRISRRKRLRAHISNEFDAPTHPALQDPETGTWSLMSVDTSITENTEDATSEPCPSLPPSHHLYLLRPRTPSCYPKVLVPIDPSQSLEVILRGRVVLEFPTIYVLCVDSTNLPDQFMLEDNFLLASRESKFENPDTEMEDARKESSEEDSGSDTSSSGSDTSTSGSDSDQEVEDGEIEEVVPAVWGGRPRIL